MAPRQGIAVDKSGNQVVLADYTLPETAKKLKNKKDKQTTGYRNDEGAELSSPQYGHNGLTPSH